MNNLRDQTAESTVLAENLILELTGDTGQFSRSSIDDTVVALIKTAADKVALRALQCSELSEVEPKLVLGSRVATTAVEM